MPLWGKTDSNTAFAVPKYLTAEQKTRTFADNRGWVLRQTKTDVHGNTRYIDEVLVAMGDDIPGASFLGNATISGVYFGDSVGTSTTSALLSTNTFVYVTYNELVDVTGGAPTMTLTVAATTGNTLPATVTATYRSGTGTNRLLFSFDTYSNTGTYTINTQTIANTAGVKIVDTGTATAADMTIESALAGANSIAGTVTAVNN